MAKAQQLVEMLFDDMDDRSLGTEGIPADVRAEWQAAWARVLDRALDKERAKGFARAKELAATGVENAPPSFNRNDHAERIRLIQDDGT